MQLKLRYRSNFFRQNTQCSRPLNPLLRYRHQNWIIAVYWNQRRRSSYNWLKLELCSIWWINKFSEREGNYILAPNVAKFDDNSFIWRKSWFENVLCTLIGWITFSRTFYVLWLVESYILVLLWFSRKFL